MILYANLSEAQTGVGYRFYGATGFLGARITSGITNPRTGIYVDAAAAEPTGTVGVFWDCDDAEVYADEFLVDRIILETNLNATVSSRSSHSATDIWAVGTRSLTTFGTLVSDIITAVWGASTRTLSAFGFAVGPTLEEISYQIISDHGTGSYVTAGSGTGANAVTITVTDTGAVPLQNALVRVTEGINSFTALTDVDGIVSFSLDAATYDLSITKDGYQFIPKSIEITTSDINFVEEMTGTVLLPPFATEEQTVAILYTKDSGGNIQPFRSVYFQLTQSPVLGAYSNSISVISNSNGRIAVLLLKASTYRGRRGFRDVDWTTFTTTSDDEYAIPAIIGKE